MSDYYSQFDATEEAFVNNTITDCNDEALQKHLLLLSIEPIENTSVQHRNIIRGITINHILLQRHIDRLNKQNAKTERWVIALAIAALISSVVQIFSPVLFREQPIAAQQQTPETKLVSPSQGLHPSTGQSAQKNPVSK